MSSRDENDLTELRPCYSVEGLRAFVAKHHPDYELREKARPDPFAFSCGTHGPYTPPLESCPICIADSAATNNGGASNV